MMKGWVTLSKNVQSIREIVSLYTLILPFENDELLIILLLSISTSSNITDNTPYDINAECQLEIFHGVSL